MIQSNYSNGNIYKPNNYYSVGSNLDAKSHPPPRPESPSPALPPKKAKQPPPRPAPPRPLQVNSEFHGSV